MTTPFYIPGRQHEAVRAQAEALREVLSLVAAYRPDLAPEVLEAGVMELAKGTAHSAQDWADHCLVRVRAGELLPWESGATGAGEKY